MKKVLILGVSAVQYEAIKLIKENYPNIEVHALAASNDGPGANAADIFNEINIIDLEKVINYTIKNKIDLIYSVGSDIAMPISAAVSEAIGLPHFVSSVVAKNCNQKNMMRTILGPNFQGNIPFQTLSSLNEFNFNYFGQYPLFLKPTDSQGQRGIVKIDNEQMLIAEFEKSKNYSQTKQAIIEKYIDGPEISVNGYLVNGVLKICEISDRVTWPKFEGLIHKHILPTRFSKVVCDKTVDLLQRSATKMDILNGPVYAQIKIENNEPYLIEITPRLDGCHMWNLIHHAKNFNLLKLTFDHLLLNDLSELTNNHNQTKSSFTLEFLCQKPNTPAEYPQEFSSNSLTELRYYSIGENIRTINNKFEKIAYKIIETEKL